MIALLLVLVGPIGVKTAPVNNSASGAPEQVQIIQEVAQPTIQSEAPTPEQSNVVEPAQTVDWTTNPNNCNLETQYVRADNLECIDKPVVAPSSTGTTDCGDNVYKQYIYQKESGCRTNAINPNGGACGIGQALPCSKLPCSLSDFACQDAWFTNYAVTRYGSWEAAYNFWIANNWW